MIQEYLVIFSLTSFIANFLSLFKLCCLNQVHNKYRQYLQIYQYSYPTKEAMFLP